MNAKEIRELVMGTEEASRMWGLSQDHIKKLCRLGRCEAFLVGKTWIVLREQPNPAKKKEPES